MREYLVLVTDENLDLVSGLLNFITTDVKVFPDICKDRIGIFFRVKEDCKEDFDKYKVIMESRNLIEFKQILSEKKKPLPVNEKPVKSYDLNLNNHVINHWFDDLKF